MRDIVLDTARGRFGALRNGNTGGVPLLALHGWLDNAASFLPMAPMLGGYDLVALDMPGHGRSFHYPADAEYSLFSTILDVLAAADTLGWERFAVLGHSMGGAIASMLATAAPERIEHLFLIEALGPLSGSEDSTASRLRDSVTQRRALDGKRKRVFTDPDVAVQARMQTNIAALDEASSRLLIERGIRAVEGGFEWSSDVRLTLPTAVRMSETQVHDCLRAIVCPVVLLVADPTPPYFTPAMRDARVARVPQIRSMSLPGSHHLHMTHPAEVIAALGL
ncbi:MAG: alpha/beta hydrolase [Xanthomonadales bacterium]|nr:alpha/beta hydrolase [Xanthomonadales bacterium]